MIEREGPLSLSRQCALLKVSRSSQYYRPKGESTENLALMRCMDELHMAYPFYGSRQMMRRMTGQATEARALRSATSPRRRRPPLNHETTLPPCSSTTSTNRVSSNFLEH